MSVDSLGLALGKGDPVTFWASRTDESACLVIKSDGTHCEIGMDREHVEALHDQLPDVLAGLDQWAAEQQACEKAAITEKRAVDAAAQALDVAEAAEQAGAHDLAASLREAAAEASTKADAVDETVRAFEAATVDADHAASKLVHLTREVDAELDRVRGWARPTGAAGGECCRVIAFAEGDIVATIGLTVGRDVEVEFLVNPHFPKTITLVIGESVAEIALDPATVEALRDKADTAVRELRNGVAALRAEAAVRPEVPTLVGADGVAS